MKFEIELKATIKEKYGSIRAFSKAIDTPYSSIDNIFKRGIMGVSLQIVLKICAALNIDIESIKDDKLIFKNDIIGTNNPIESKLINDFRSLSVQGKEYVLQTLNMAKNTYSDNKNTVADMLINDLASAFSKNKVQN